MKIILATGIYYPEIGGPALLVKDLATELKKRGHEPLVLTYSQRGRFERETYPVIRIFRSFKLFNYFKYFTAILRQVKPGDQVVVFDNFSAALPVAVASLFKKLNFCVRVGGDFLWEMAAERMGKQVTLTDYYKTRFSLREVFYFLLIRFIYQRADKLIVTTNYQHRMLEEYYGLDEKKLHLLPNAFPKVSPALPGQVSLPKTPVKKQLLFAGRFTKLKNLKRLLEAMAKLENKDYQLVLAGEGPEEANLRQLTQELKLDKRVIFNQPVFGQELNQLIKESAWLILPSISDVSPNIVLKAIALNTPVLMTQHSGFYDYLTGHLFFLKYPFNTEELIVKLDYLLSLDDDHYASVKHALTKIDQSYGFEQMVERFLLLLSL